MDSAVAELRKQGLRIDAINVRSNETALKKYNVCHLPTFIYYLDQEEVRRASGNLSTGELRQLWRKPIF